MASLFSSSAYSYIDIVYGQASGVPIESREFPCYCFYWEYTKDLVYSIPIHTIEVLRERVLRINTLISGDILSWTIPLGQFKIFIIKMVFISYQI
jgi:hypothetical protein